MKKTSIWKFQLKFEQRITVEMPMFAEILNVQSQFNEPVMWALIDTEQCNEAREFEIFGTGQPIPPLPEGIERKYINTFQCDDGNYVFHVFELKK